MVILYLIRSLDLVGDIYIHLTYIVTLGRTQLIRILENFKGSILVAAAKCGAYVFGSDIDYLMLHGRTKPTRIKQKVNSSYIFHRCNDFDLNEFPNLPGSCQRRMCLGQFEAVWLRWTVH